MHLKYLKIAHAISAVKIALHLYLQEIGTKSVKRFVQTKSLWKASLCIIYAVDCTNAKICHRYLLTRVEIKS